MSYQLLDDGNDVKVKALADGVVFPLDDREPGFAGYREWLAAGNAPEVARPDAAAPNPVDSFGDEALKVILSLQNEIRDLKGLPGLKDVAELKAELKKTVGAELIAVEAGALGKS